MRMRRQKRVKKIEIEWEMAQSSFVNLHERPVHRVR